MLYALYVWKVNNKRCTSHILKLNLKKNKSICFSINRKRDDIPVSSSNRVQITKSQNTVQLAVDHVQREDAGYYTLYATSKSGAMARKDIELIVDDRSTGDDPPIFIRRLNDLTVKVGTRTRLLVDIRSSTDVKV